MYTFLCHVVKSIYKIGGFSIGSIAPRSTQPHPPPPHPRPQSCAFFVVHISTSTSIVIFLYGTKNPQNCTYEETFCRTFLHKLVVFPQNVVKGTVGIQTWESSLYILVTFWDTTFLEICLIFAYIAQCLYRGVVHVVIKCQMTIFKNVCTDCPNETLIFTCNTLSPM
jgi:hypothetical protein